MSVRVTFLILVVLFTPTNVNPQVRRNTEPLNIGFIFSLPYDISNTLRAPLGGPLSLILGAGLALIMFFGMLATPLHYIFGILPRRYHIHDAIKNVTLDSDFFSRRSFSDAAQAWDNSDTAAEEIAVQNRNLTESYPNFIESAFMLIPVEQVECRLLMICHAHGFLPWLPSQLLQFYKYFGTKIGKMDDMEQEAVIIGLEDQDQCSKVFSQCPLDIVTIGKRTFNYIVTQIIN